MSDNPTTSLSPKRTTLRKVSEWTASIERAMQNARMSEDEQKAHWEMLAFVASRTVEEFNDGR